MALTAAQRRRLPLSQFADRTNRKYPIDTEKRVRAAVSYFSKPANARMYPLSERKKIWSRIKSAAKKYKITLSDYAGPPSLEKRPRPTAKRKRPDPFMMMMTETPAQKKRFAKQRALDRAEEVILSTLRKDGGASGKSLLRKNVREKADTRYFDDAYRKLTREQKIYKHRYGDVILSSTDSRSASKVYRRADKSRGKMPLTYDEWKNIYETRKMTQSEKRKGYAKYLNRNYKI